MRVLVISSRDMSHPKWAGGDAYLQELISRLIVSGHEFTMICERYHGGKPLSVDKGMRVYRVRGGVFRLVRNFQLYLRLKNWADVVIEEVEGPAGPFFSCLYVKKPLVGLWHQPGRKILFAQYPAVLAVLLSMIDILYGRLLRDHAVIVPSLASSRGIVNLGIPVSRIFVVPGAAYLKRDKFKPIASVTAPFFLTLGKYRKYKCFDHAILAMKSVVAKHPECSLIMGGTEGNVTGKSVLRLLSDQAGVGSNVRILSLTQEEKNWALANCEALVVTSPIEGFSLVSIEANSFGTPVIASSGVPEDVVVDGLNGVRYSFGNIPELATDMLRFLEDSPKKAWSKNCRTFSQQFSWEKSARTFQEALQIARTDCRRQHPSDPAVLRHRAMITN